MASPVTPDQFADLVPTAGTEPCDAAKNIFFKQPRLLYQLVSYILNVDGTLKEDFINELFPPGLIMHYGGSVAPSGWLLCDGGEYSRTDYARLFAIIGEKFGSGDGVNTFNVPSSKKRGIVGPDASSLNFDIGNTGGEEEVILLLENLPKFKPIDTTLKIATHPGTSGQEAGGDSNPSYSFTATPPTFVSVDEIGGDVAHNNWQPYLVLPSIIKY